MKSRQEIEIERKWLLKNKPNLEWDNVISISQCYVMIDGKPCRIRYSTTKDEKSIEVIHKEKTGYGTSIEHHYDITHEKAEEITSSAGNDIKVVLKIRYVKNYDGYKIEIDDHQIIKLVTMEVEVPYIDFPLEFDEEIKKEIILETTGNAAFDNSNLAKK